MRGIALATLILSDSDDYQRITIAECGSAARLGYSSNIAASGIFGSIQGEFTRIGVGQFIRDITCFNADTATAMYLFLNGNLTQSYLSSMSVMRGDGNIRWFDSASASSFSTFVDSFGITVSWWQWTGLPVNYVWTSSDIGEYRVFKHLK